MLIGMHTKHEYQPFTIMSQSTLNWIFHAVLQRSLCIWNFPLFFFCSLSLKADDWTSEHVTTTVLCSLLTARFLSLCFPLYYFPSLDFTSLSLGIRHLCAALWCHCAYTIWWRFYVCRAAYPQIFRTNGNWQVLRACAFHSKGKNERMKNENIMGSFCTTYGSRCVHRIKVEREVRFAEAKVCILNAMRINRWNLLKAVAVSKASCVLGRGRLSLM